MSKLDRLFAHWAATAETPPSDVLNRAPTPEDVQDYPEYYIAGAGRAVASRTQCAHGYYLTDSCPNC